MSFDCSFWDIYIVFSLFPWGLVLMYLANYLFYPRQFSELGEIELKLDFRLSLIMLMGFLGFVIVLLLVILGWEKYLLSSRDRSVYERGERG